MALSSISLPRTPSTVLVTVDQSTTVDFSGALHSVYLPTSPRFETVFQLIELMNQLFDENGAPQSNVSFRSFEKSTENPSTLRRERLPVRDEALFDTLRGQCATFTIYVQFRRNATWQGAIGWIEEEKRVEFRSALEMVRVMRGALDSANKNK